MKVLGITGGVGAGKSTVLAYLERRYGARVLMADEVGRHLQEPGQDCYRQIVAAFGKEMLQADASLDRQKLAALIFSDEEKRRRLNAIVHPAVKAYIIEEIEKERRSGEALFCVVESALLLEDRYDLICDEIWYLCTETSVRIRRLAESRGYSREKTLEIIKSQRNDAEYREKCDFVIDNSSDFVENTYEQIDKGLVEHGFL